MIRTILEEVVICFQYEAGRQPISGASGLIRLIPGTY